MPYKDKEKARESARKSHRKYYQLNKDKEKERSKRYRETHPTYKKEYDRRTQCGYLDLEHYKWEDVEGYDGWTTNTEVHHRREGIGYSVAQLKEQGQYYNCRADELICVTHAEHKRIHEQIDKFFKRNNYKEK